MMACAFWDGMAGSWQGWAGMQAPYARPAQQSNDVCVCECACLGFVLRELLSDCDVGVLCACQFGGAGGLTGLARW